jgi:hypothetical protein
MQLTLHIPYEMEAKLRILAEQEQITPELFVQKLINNLAPTKAEVEFFSFAGLWENRDITQETLRAKAWGQP